MTGSFGTLALTVDATFKLVPAAPGSKTVVVTPGSFAELEAMRAGIAGSQLMPTAVELQMPPGRLLVRFETSVRAAEQQAADVMAMAERHGAQWEEVSGAAEQKLWEGHVERPWNGSGCVCKISVLPDELVSLLQWLRDTPGLPRWDLVGRAALGVVLLRLEGDVADQEPVVAALRARAPAGRAHVSILRAEPELKGRLGAWDEPADTLRLKQAIKRQFDPAGILNPGRGPGGL
jgi:glycolate oxidase FAD binding subunit